MSNVFMVREVSSQNITTNQAVAKLCSTSSLFMPSLNRKPPFLCDLFLITTTSSCLKPTFSMDEHMLVTVETSAALPLHSKEAPKENWWIMT